MSGSVGQVVRLEGGDWSVRTHCLFLAVFAWLCDERLQPLSPSFHFTSFHFISFRFISFHFISVLFHFISFHFISSHFHFISVIRSSFASRALSWMSPIFEALLKASSGASKVVLFVFAFRSLFCLVPFPFSTREFSMFGFGLFFLTGFQS